VEFLFFSNEDGWLTLCFRILVVILLFDGVGGLFFPLQILCAAQLPLRYYWNTRICSLKTREELIAEAIPLLHI